MTKNISVYFESKSLLDQQKLGTLRADSIRGKEIFSFEYEQTWLGQGFAQVLDPDLKYFTGSQFLKDDKVNFDLFLDSSPDRWGRMLMNRKESIEAKLENRAARKLMESDYLLGVSDVSRMGAIRFKLDDEGEFVSSDSGNEIPPFSSIRELEQASRNIEKDDFFENPKASKWLRMLFAPGSSLGGARPKANIYNLDKSLWIAKFPSKNDNNNTGAWEFIVNQMAIDLGINIAYAKAEKYTDNGHTYISKRFDRIGNERLHYASAMTLLGLIDGANYEDGISYLDIVGILERYGSNPSKDIQELWRRIVFSVAISNTDDHLRNHGFLLNSSGWALSPAFDINPIPDGVGLSLNIDENNNTLDFDLCMEVIDYFRMKENEAKQFIINTKKVVSTWKSRAKKMNISSAEIVDMERAFRI